MIASAGSGSVAGGTTLKMVALSTVQPYCGQLLTGAASFSYQKWSKLLLCAAFIRSKNGKMAFVEHETILAHGRNKLKPNEDHPSPGAI